MMIHDKYIYNIEDILNEKYCKTLIYLFEKNKILHESGREFDYFDFEHYFYDTDELEKVKNIFIKYKDFYLKENFRFNPEIKVGKMYFCKYHNKKNENANINVDSFDSDSASNIFTMILSLNTVKNGGEICFLEPINGKTNLKQGELLIFPSNLIYPYVHLPIKNKQKYVIRTNIIFK